MNKAWLVARREFMENLRTKTFWIGILVFPVMLVLMALIPIWFQQNKDVRRYAVLDESGWVLEEVEKEASFPDLAKVYREARKRQRQGRPLDDFPLTIQLTTRAVANLSDEEFETWLQGAVRTFDPGPEAFQEYEKIMAALPADKLSLLEQARRPITDEIRSWWRSLTPEEAARFGSNLARSRYQRIQVRDLGDDPQTTLNRMVDQGELFAWFVIGKDPLKSSKGCKYVSNNQTDLSLKKWFEGHVNEVVRRKRIEAHGMDKRVAREILARVAFEEKKVTEGGREEAVRIQDKIHQWVPVAFAYMLWIAVFSVAQMLLTNTVEEKSNRIIEVLLSSVSPLQLMSGKIAGIAATGLTILSSWMLFLFLGIKFGPSLLGESLTFDLTFVIKDPIYLSSFIIYFLLGYLFYSAFLVGLGSVCNSLKEAQNLMQPVMLLMIVPLLAIIPVAEDPNGELARFLSWVPPFTPFVMMNRAAGPPTTSEYVLTTVLLLAAIVLAFLAAARIFRIGILMTGKRPRLLQILGWLRTTGSPAVEERDETP